MPNNNPRPSSFSQRNQTDDLIDITPNWLLRSGITVVALVTIVVLMLAAFLRYPDKIIAKGIMTSQNPPIEHVTNFSGIIEEVYAANGDFVKEDEPLIYLKNNTDKNDLKKLEGFIKKYQAVKKVKKDSYSDNENAYLQQIIYQNLKFPTGLQLGELQQYYSRLQLGFSQLNQTYKQSGTQKQIGTIRNEIINTRELRKILLDEKDYSKEEMALIERDLKRQTELNKKGVISDLDKEKVESQWVSSQKQYNNLDQGIIQNKIREEQLILETQKLVEDRASKIQLHRYDIDQVINNLEPEIIEWKRKYYINSEISGEISFVPNINKDQFIAQNTVVLSIIPVDNSNKKQIRVLTTNNGIGKINVDDKVIVKVDGYPYKEFGLLISKVNSISNLPEIIRTQNGEMRYLYSIDINLPDTLKTNYNEEIEFRPNSSVIAEIITKDKSILERLFETFLSLVNQE